jgi:hypothetical protein
MVTVKNTIFQALTLCNPVEFCQDIEGSYCLHLQGQRVIQAYNQREVGSSQSRRTDGRTGYMQSELLVGYLLGLVFDSEYGSSTALRNDSKLLPDYTASHA